ncbi:hypothetical protein [Diaminobutyricimonas aerilata]|nr:hypothetical protein [Diaminobutyricimonas aerilata]
MTRSPRIPNLRRLRRDDEGSALVLVVALVAVSVLVGVAVSSSVLAANSVTTVSRADVQAKASADAGIDVAYGRILTGSYDCIAPSVPNGPNYTATIEYRNSGGTVLPCTGSTVTGTPASAVITSTGRAANRGTSSSVGDTHVMRAELTIVTGQAAAALDKAIFGESSLTLTNNTELIGSAPGVFDADVYTNGSVNCKTQVPIQGDIHSQVDLTLENNCKLKGGVWAKGNINFSSGVEVDGSVYSASGGLLNLGTAHVGGTVVANGPIQLSDNGGRKPCSAGGASHSVCGSIVSLAGGVTIGQQASVGGSVYAKDSIGVANHNTSGYNAIGRNALSTSGNLIGNGTSSTQGGKVGGSVRVHGEISIPDGSIGDKNQTCTNKTGDPYPACGTLTIPVPDPAASLPNNLGYPATGSVPAQVLPPARDSFPKIASDDASLQKWRDGGYTVVLYSGSNSCGQVKTAIQNAETLTHKTLYVARGCLEPINFDNVTVKLGADLAVMNAGGFRSQNNFELKSTDSTKRQVAFIVPSDAGFVSFAPVPGDPNNVTVSCTNTQNAGDIKSDKFNLVNVKMLLYSPCNVSINNHSEGMQGQVYGGHVNFPGNTRLIYQPLDIPGVTSSSTTVSTPGSVTLTARYDVAG